MGRENAEFVQPLILEMLRADCTLYSKHLVSRMKEHKEYNHTGTDSSANSTDMFKFAPGHKDIKAAEEGGEYLV